MFEELPSGLADWIRSDDAALFQEDIFAWGRWYRDDNDSGSDIVATFARLFFALGEFRSLFDYRARQSSNGKTYCWCLPRHSRTNDLNIRCDDIGPRFLIQHGNSTWIFARSIGSDFWINQNVTLGSNGRGIPNIGNKVTILTGAVVVGGCTISDNVQITANAVVHFDVPANSRVFAARSVIVPQ